MRQLFFLLSLAALETKMLRFFWRCRDLNAGDTADYFTYATQWHLAGITNIAYSPLYSIFYSWFLYLSSDAYWVTMAHRIALISINALLVIYIFQRQTSRPVAWLLSAWWVLTPITFDPFYEVHLFVLLPSLAITALLCGEPGPARRGLAFGLLVITVVLIRQEYAVSLLLLGAGLLVIEFRNRTPLSRLLLPYALPLAGGLVLFLTIYANRTTPNQGFSDFLQFKNRQNLCQIFATAYQQRHPEWRGNPWTDCYDLNQQIFGKREPLYLEAFLLNPAAMMEHTAWNFHLMPAAAQVLLFGAMSGADSPDYNPVPVHRLAGYASAGYLALLAAGGWMSWRKHARIPQWIAGRGIAGYAIASFSLQALVVAVLGRPRPAYILAALPLLMLLAGWSIQAFVKRPPHEFVIPAIAAALILLVPPYVATHCQGILVRENYNRLATYRELIRSEQSVLAARAASVCSYLATAKGYGCRQVMWDEIAARIEAGSDVKQALEHFQVDMFYADHHVAQHPRIIEFARDAEKYGWRSAATGAAPQWFLFERMK